MAFELANLEILGLIVVPAVMAAVAAPRLFGSGAAAGDSLDCRRRFLPHAAGRGFAHERRFHALDDDADAPGAIDREGVPTFSPRVRPGGFGDDKRKILLGSAPGRADEQPFSSSSGSTASTSG